MSAKDIDEMLSLAYEVEGLLLVAQRLGDDVPEVITTKLARKAGELADMAAAATQAATPAPIEEDVVEAQAQAQAVAGLPSDDYDPTETWQHDNGEEPGEVFAVDYEEPPHGGTSMPPADAGDNETKPADGDAADGEPLRVDEAVQRAMRRDLSRAFSINDRYRYCRELFGGDAAAMTAALGDLATLGSLAEAEAYCRDRLGWSGDGEVEQEFMQVLRHHFD